MQMVPSLKFDYLLSLYFLMPKLLIHISAYALHLWLRRRFGTHSKQKEEDEVLLATAAVHACKDVATAAASVVKLAHSLRFATATTTTALLKCRQRRTLSSEVFC